MRIAINTRLLLPNKLEGLGWYTHEVCKRITQQHPEHEFIFLFDREYDPKFIYADNVKPVVLFPQARHPFLFFYWFEISVRKALKKEKADLFFSPDGYLSLSTNVPSVPVIHDLNFEHYPEDLPWLVRKYYRYFFPKFAKKASRILTVSEYSKQDIANQYNISENNIDVSYNGINQKYHPITEEVKEQMRAKYTNHCPYFIFVGSLHPRKNITRLFEAFDIFKERTGSNVKLVIVGDKYWWNDQMEKVYQEMTHNGEIIFTGHLPEEELNSVMGAALALTYVSYFEGFGIPLVEAMQCGIPVLSSDATALPEVAQGAAIYVNPFDKDSIARGMQELYDNPELRTQLIERGFQRKNAFDWQYTADAVWSTIEKTINQIQS